MKRGQGATEILILLGVGMIVLLLIITTTTNNFSAYRAKYSGDLANDAINELESGAIFVYQQGVGAKTQVKISLPGGINHTDVTGKTMLIAMHDGRVAYRNLDFNVTGSIPILKGNYKMDLESISGFVNISQSS